MKKGAETILIVGLLVIAGFLGFVTFESNVVKAATYNVGSGVGNDTTSIQDAIDNFASDSDTIYVWGGTYYENVIVDKTITLIGEGKDLAIIHGNTNFDGVRVERDWANVTGFTITNGTNGVYVNASNNVRIEDNNISFNFQFGIYITSSSYNDIIGNNVTSNNEDGIHLIDSTYNNIIDNNVIENDRDGIYFDTSTNNNITNNYLLSNHDDGIHLYSGSDYNNVSSNNVSSSWDDGIYLVTASINTISNNYVWNNSDGIYATSSSQDNTIFNNTVVSNRDDGIYLSWWSFSNTIKDNNITYNVDGINLNGADGTMIFDNNISYNTDYGIYIGSSAGLVVTGNTMIEDGIFIFSNSFADWNSHTIDTSNTANGKPVYYLKDQTGGVVPAGAGQVILVNCTGILVFGQVLNNCSVGLELGFSHDNLIFNNNEANNIYGFYTYYSNGNTISGNYVDNNRIRGIYIGFGNNNEIFDNNATGNDLGIYIRGASGNNVTNNNATGNDLGIYIRGASGNNVTNNNASYNVEGLYLDSSDWTNVSGNIFSNNTNVGINVEDSYNNTFWENDVIGNENGIYLFSSRDNLIYHNSIINNNNQSSDDSVGLNNWDDGYPSGGNYWSDWSPITPDLFSGATTPQITGSPDGICDTQYDIDADSIDYYPLKGPWDPTTIPPTVPLLLNATDGVTYVYLFWNPPADDGGLPISYRIYRGLSEDNEVFLSEIGDILFYNDTSVNGGTTYFYKVSAVNIRGESPQSNEVNGTPLAPPDPPTGLSLFPGNLFVNLSWFAPTSDGGSTVTGYNIYRNGTSGFYDFIPAGQLWFNDTNVTNGLTYTYNITAVNGIGESPKTSDESATPMTLPAAPENLQTEAGDSYVNLTWDIPLDDGGSPITGYNIYRNGTTLPYGTTTGETWFYDAGAINGITYTYNISAVNGVGEGPSVTISATPMTIPSVPENLQASAGDEVVHLTWDPPLDDGGSAITHYNVYRSDFVGVYATILGGQLSYDDVNVVNGVTYTYIISANNSVGEGAKTLGVNDVPMGAPSAPRNLDLAVGDGFVNLTWDVPSDNGGSAITGYNIYKDGVLYDTVPAGQLWLYDDDVTNGVEYTYDVAAINIIGEGPDISEDATPMTVPSAPQNLQAVVGNRVITISWSTPSEDGGSPVTGYVIYRDGTVTIFQTVSAAELTYEDDDVADGVTYTYYVSAVNTVGEGALSEGASAKAGSGPAVPSNFTAAVGDSYVYLA
jgi:parallel beta-helix repeat protein